jgi:pimeloyl-ACP methyl ester carboxylesterase
MNSRIVRAGLAILFVAALATVADLRHGPQASDSKNSAMPPSSIPTFSMENVGREAFFYVGGEYVGPPGKEVMHGAMYVEVMVPKQIRQKYPVVFFHGNGQTGAVWKQTPDGRPGWAYYLINQGYVVYMVDYPAGHGRQTRSAHSAGPGADLDRSRSIRRGFPADEDVHAVAERFTEERHDGRSGFR